MSDSDLTGAGGVDPSEENKLIAERRSKLAMLREAGSQPFPNDFRRTAEAEALQRDFKEISKEDLEEKHEVFAVAGRLIRNRGAFLGCA